MNDFVVETKNLELLEDVDFSGAGELALKSAITDLWTTFLGGANISPWEFAHDMAIENWRRYRPKQGASRLEQVRGAIEMCYHFCQIEAWEDAKKTLLKPVEINLPIPLHKQLGIWGHYAEQIELYENLLGKLDRQFNCFLLHGMGNVWYYLGQPQIAIRYYQQQLELAEEIADPQAIAQAYGGLGKIYASLLSQPQPALSYLQRQLELARELDDRSQIVEALNYMAAVYRTTSENPKCLQCHQQALQIARKLGDRTLEMDILGQLATTYTFLGQPQKAIGSLQQQLEFSQERGDRTQAYTALLGLGKASLALKDYRQAIVYDEKALAIAIEMNNPCDRATALVHLGVTYTRMKQYQRAIPYFQQELEISSIAKKGIVRTNARKLVVQHPINFHIVQ